MKVVILHKIYKHIVAAILESKYTNQHWLSLQLKIAFGILNISVVSA